MTHPVPFPANLPAYSLDHWLSPELARVSPPNAPSRLRQLADAQGTLAAGWSSAIAGGPVLALAGLFFSVVSGNPAAMLVLGPLGAALTVLGLISWKRVRGRLPNTNKLLITRGPGNARGGIAMVAGLAGLIGAAMVMALPTAAERGTTVSLIGAYLLVVAVLVACIVVPSAVLGRARESFRLRIQSNPELRRAVEQDLAVWRDPHGSAGYGPL
ncbi:hypothetical protein [Arthrobacter sp. OY3WO11]|uniref:hypothetical protein n=1 Tax=Arthrobacter sp. OY3WO11 TaxID=1835723 RepID=UPI0007CFC6CB|nr:hypothetical protein [Arthrobacter sp. OY3WO11]OAE02477.1 hypothetical protein A6A22_14370 [Arthrobacter sp. OY3WO11]